MKNRIVIALAATLVSARIVGVQAQQTNAATRPNIQTVFIILMENHNWSQIKGSPIRTVHQQATPSRGFPCRTILQSAGEGDSQQQAWGMALLRNTRILPTRLFFEVPFPEGR